MTRVLNDHNGGVTSNVFHHHVKALADLKKQEKAIRDKIKLQKKQAVDDGIVVRDLNWAVEQADRPVAEQIQEYNRRISYLRFLKSPVGTQATLIDDFDGVTSMTDEQRAQFWHDEGYQASATGKNRDVCTHDPNSEAGRKWMEGYQTNQDELAQGIKKGPKPEAAAAEPKNAAQEALVEGAKKRRGRPPKNKPAETAAKDGEIIPPTKGVGVTYWHNPAEKRVLEVKDGSKPEGFQPVKREEFDKLSEKYKAEAQAEWDAAEKGDDDSGEAPAPDTDTPPIAADDFDDDAPSPDRVTH